LKHATVTAAPKRDESAAMTAEELDALVNDLNSKATDLGKERGLEQLEELRRQRWDAISKTGDAGVAAGSVWLKAYAAIRAVDGPEHADVAEDVSSAGLVNELRYKEACESLRTAWRAMTEANNGPILGEVAVRLFEVAQQARSCYQDALDPDSPNNVASISELVDALKEADKRDPCCIMARALLFYLDEPDPSEAFLRAEVRKDFKSRQQSLVAMAHPLILPHGAPSGQPSAAENADAPVMPWHAAVELDLAKSAECLLKDLEYTKPLTPDFYKLAANWMSYRIPGEILSGTDAFNQPFQFFQGRTIIGRSTDSNGLPRSVVMYLDAERQWDYRYLDLLWREPTEEQLQSNSKLRDKHNLIKSHAYRTSLTLGKETFRLYDYPVRDTAQLIKDNVQVFCVRKLQDFERLKYVVNKNKTSVVGKMESPWALQPVVQTTPLVREAIETIEQINDVTKHPLNDLLNLDILNPLVIVSEKDSIDCRPNLIAGQNGAVPYLDLDNGEKLSFSIEGTENSPCCYVQYDGATLYMPLSVDSVPKVVLLGTPIGKAFVEVLEEAGYTEDQSIDYIRSVMADRTLPLPKKFVAMLQARSRSQGSPPLSVFSRMLSEKGWQGETNLSNKLESLFYQYGFRYLRDLRGNWIVNAGLAESAGKGASESEKGPSLKDYPYEFRAKDGKNRVSTSQIYSWPDYTQIKTNISREFLSKLLMFHPCLPGLDLLAREAATPLVHPSNNFPEYLRNAQQDHDASIATADISPQHSAEITSPFSLRMTSDDKAQQQTLSNLHLAYYSLVAKSAKDNTRLLVLARVLRILKGYQLVADNDEESAAIRNLAVKVSSDYEKAAKARESDLAPLLAIQLESARNYARRRYFHKAIVFYNDFLAELYPVDATEPDETLFTGVPTTERMQGYITELDRTIDRQMLLLNVQVELAGVLNASGLVSSASYVWHRCVDDYEYCLKPSLRVAQELLESYGLRLSKRAQEEIKEIEATVESARDALVKYEMNTDWRVMANVAGNNARVAVQGRIAAVKRLLERDAEEGLSGEDAARLERELKELPFDDGLGFEEWMALKLALLKRPALAFRTKDTLPPWQACPLTYDEKRGFHDGVKVVEDLLRSVDSSKVVDWCKKPLPGANEDPLAAAASFMVGWYRMERNERAHGRAAFMNLARVHFVAAKNVGGTAAGLVHEYNAYSALTSAGSIIESLPGLSSYKTDFSDFLAGQLVDWEKRWFAVGSYGPHASEQRLELQMRAWQATTVVWRTRNSWRNNRYYFPDYTFRFGSVPDYLVEKVFLSPQLFKTLTPEELASREDDAVEGSKWALIERGQAEQYLNKQVIDGQLKKELVFLRQ